MQDGDNRVLILDAARVLFERNPGGFTVASVCRQTGLSRARVRKHFATKSALVACLNGAAVKDEIAASAQEPVLTEARNETTALVQAAPPIVTELPPLVTDPAPVPVARKKKPSAPRFQARETAQQILAKAEEARQAAPQSGLAANWEIKIPAVLRMAAAAGLIFAALIVSTSLISFGGFARATQPPPAPIQEKHAAIAPEVLVIDATGAAPDPMYQETPPALRDIVVRARRGETQAQVQLAQSFLKGDGFAADPIAAARWSDEAAAQGDATAQFILGSLYAEGIKPNARLAFDWFSAAASRGNVKAMHNLAIAYMNGTGVAQDSKAAAAWFEKAAGAGYRNSAFDLAVLYERGEGVAQNSQAALKWYEQAASFGDPEAMQRATYLRSWQVAKR